MTTVAAQNDPYLLPMPDADTPVIPGHLIVGSARTGNARFGDRRWPLGLMNGNPSAIPVSIGWAQCPAELEGELRLAAWNMINGQLRPTFVKLKVGTRQRFRARVGMTHLRNTVHIWFTLAAWLCERGITSLSACDADLLDAYAFHLVDAGASRSKTKHVLAALTRLWAFDQMSAAPSGIGKPRWEDAGIDDYLPAAGSGVGENGTEPLDETTMGPLLIWAMRVVEDFAEDIRCARAERQRLARLAEANLGTPAGRAALETYLGPQVDAGAPLPSMEHLGRLRIARTYIAGSTGASRSQVDEFMTRHGRGRGREPVLGGPCPLAVPVTGRIEQRPWTGNIGFDQAEAMAQHVVTAAFIVVAYLTGMRPQEVLGLRSGCCPDPGPGAAAGHHLIRGRHYKSATDTEGNHLSVGVERDIPWVAITPVVNAIRVLESMVPDGALLFGIQAHSRPDSAPGDGAVKSPTMGVRIERFVAWANEIAAAHDRHSEAILPDRHGAVGTARFRRTLAWHIARRPGGLVALAIQYGHLRTAVSGSYASRSRNGIDELLDVESVRAVADTVAGLREALEAGGAVSGPAAQHAIKTAVSGPFFDGVVINATTARRLAANQDVMLYENPNAFLLCRFRRSQALCHRDATAAWPSLDRCVPECGNVVRTDRHAAALRERAEVLVRCADHAPGPAAERLRRNADKLRSYADQHDRTRMTLKESAA